jgi:hypothetical protein
VGDHLWCYSDGNSDMVVSMISEERKFPYKMIRFPWNAVDIHYRYKVPIKTSELEIEFEQFNHKIPDDLVSYMEEAPPKDWKPACYNRCIGKYPEMNWHYKLNDTMVKNCKDCPYRKRD